MIFRKASHQGKKTEKSKIVEDLKQVIIRNTRKPHGVTKWGETFHRHELVKMQFTELAKPFRLDLDFFFGSRLHLNLEKVSEIMNLRRKTDKRLIVNRNVGGTFSVWWVTQPVVKRAGVATAPRGATDHDRRLPSGSLGRRCGSVKALGASAG